MSKKSFIPGFRNLFSGGGHHVCPWWLAYTFDNPLRRYLHDPDALLGPFVKPGMTVADIGCGLGYFSLAMARMVGSKGEVLAIDLQQKMLDRMRKRANRIGRGGNIRSILAARDDIRIHEPVDFVLTFWMVHEVENIPRFFTQVSSVMKPQGKVLIAEPRLHVPVRRFREILHHAREAGFADTESPPIRMSRSAVLVRNP